MPYQKHTPYLKEFLLTSTGKHIAGALMHFYNTRKNDYIEMGLHHIIAVFMCAGAYMLNIWETAILIAFIHDIAEVITTLVKTLSETHFHNASASMFIYLMITWCYTRVFVFSQFVYYLGTKNDLDFRSPIIYPFMMFLLSSLLVLQIHWQILFFRLLWDFIKSGYNEDT